jgi:MSHA biogenesis protein MshN
VPQLKWAHSVEMAVPAKPPPEIDKRSQELNPQQLAENEYRAGATLLSSGRATEAQERFAAALRHHSGHAGARQALFGLLLNAKKMSEAEDVLQDGLRLNSRQPGFAMALARLQTDRGDTSAAVETLQKSAAAAAGIADYHAFLAALLQREARHAEAAAHYHSALALAPASGVWNMGLGISLQALNRRPEAQDAFRRAKASNALNAELQAFVDERLRQLQGR